MAVKFTNNAKTTLASGITSTATSATVVDGSVFPTLGAGEYFYCTFDDTTNNEIVKVTARSGNTLTIVRGVDNTTARAFSSGDAAELRATAGLLTDIQENIAAKSANQTVYNTTTASSATDYDIGIDPSVEANAMVFLNGVMQHHDTFSFSGSTLTFDTAPSDGMALEVIVDNLINLQSSNLTVDTFTAADVGGSPQTDFTLSDSPAAETNLIVFVDGVFQDQDAYTISSNVLTMTDGVVADRVVTVYVINPVNIGTPSDGTVTSAKLSGNITMPGSLTVTSYDVAFDSPTFVVDNANSRVGIGTAAPSTLLDIVGDVKMSAGLQVSGIDYPTSDGTNGQVLTTDGAGTLSFADAAAGYSDSDVETYLNTSTIYTDATNDRLGIGTSSPATKLDVSVVGGMARVGGAAGNNLFQTYTGSVGAGIWAGGQTRLYSTGSMTLSTGATLTTSAPTGYTDAVTIDSSGKVGINTADPNYKLETKDGDIATVKLTPAAGGNAVNGIRFRVNNSANTSESATLAMVNAETVNSWGGVLTFSTKTANSSPNETVTERMRLTESKLDMAVPIEISGASSDPTGSAGLVYYNTNQNKLKLYDGTRWNNIAYNNDVTSGLVAKFYGSQNISGTTITSTDGSYTGTFSTTPTLVSDVPSGAIYTQSWDASSSVYCRGNNDFSVISSGGTQHHFSVAHWIKFDTISEPTMVTVIDAGNDGTTLYRWEMQSSSSQVEFGIKSSPDFSETTNITISTGTWYHIVFTYDDANQKVYINNQLVNTTAFTAYDPATSSSQRFQWNGRFGGGLNANYSIDARFYNIRYYNRALSADEVALLYNLVD